MLSRLTNLKGLNSEQSSEYRSLKTRIGALLSQELIFSRCVQWTPIQSVVEAVAAYRNTPLVRAGNVLPTGEMGATNGTLSELVRRGYLEEMFAVQSTGEATGGTRLVRVSSLGRERLPVIGAEIDALAKSFLALDERHMSAPQPPLQWWQMLANVFGR